MLYENKLKKIYMELTERCNLNCVNCFRNTWEHIPSDMSLEVFSKIKEDLPKLDSIAIAGIGEPTVHPKFVQFSEELKEFNLELTTNAFNWSGDVIGTIAKHYKKVTISVDGLPNTFKAIRGFDFSILKENVKRLVLLKKQLNSKFPILHAQLVLSKSNVKEIKELIPLLKSTGFSKLIISNLLPQKIEDIDEIMYVLHSGEKIKQLRNSWYPAGSSNQFQIKLPQVELKTERRCLFVENGTMFITSRGDISPCYRFSHSGIEYVFGRKKQVNEWYFGNILKENIMDIWNNKEYTSLRVQNYSNRFPSCMDCDNVDFCDYVNTADADCLGNYPSCADCLWTRGFIECP